MSTNNETQGQGKGLDTMLAIRVTSGGERGKEGSGKQYSYSLPKAAFMALVGEVFDKEVENSKAENAKSGGAVSQFLHSYGVTADRMEKAGRDPFPAKGGEFGGDNMDAWLEILEFKAPRNGGNRKSAKEIKMDTILTILSTGVKWDVVKAGFPDISEDDLNAYKAKLAGE